MLVQRVLEQGPFSGHLYCKLYRRFKSVFPLQHRGRPYMTTAAGGAELFTDGAGPRPD